MTDVRGVQGYLLCSETYSFRLPKSLHNRMKAQRKHRDFITIAEFVREAIREKLDKLEKKETEKNDGDKSST